jgi:acyl-CoA synthetase (NDP forming)
MGIASPRPESLLQAALVDVALPPGHVAISMQSGSLGSSVLRQARDLQLGLSWFVSLGDKADISANDLLQFWEEDANTSVVAMYTESFGNPRKFARIARRVSQTMPIVAVRTGAASVGSLGGALYQQAGLIEVPSVNAMLHTVRVLACQPYPQGPNIAVLTNARSPGVLAEAALQTAGLVPVAGPIRLDWRSSPADFRAAIAAAVADEGIHGIVVIHAPAVADDVHSTALDIHEAALGADKPVVAIMLGGVDGPVLPGSTVPAFTFPEQAAAVLGRAYAYGQWRATQAEADPEPTRAVDPDATRLVIDEIVGAGRVQADVGEQQRILYAYGIAFATAREATPSTAAAAADQVGYPVAIKATRRRAGRSVWSGVALDVNDAADVGEAVETMVEALGSDADHLIVQTMTRPGIDLRIRCEHDERLGVIVSVGLGGAQADVIADRTSRLAPVGPAVATTMLDETRIRAALAGADIDPSHIVDAVVQAAQLASDHGRILELDLNPVIVSERGAVVTDALIRLRPTDDADQPLRRLS